jgi:hypothetical protein
MGRNNLGLKRDTRGVKKFLEASLIYILKSLNSNQRPVALANKERLKSRRYHSPAEGVLHYRNIKLLSFLNRSI